MLLFFRKFFDIEQTAWGWRDAFSALARGISAVDCVDDISWACRLLLGSSVQGIDLAAKSQAHMGAHAGRDAGGRRCAPDGAVRRRGELGDVRWRGVGQAIVAYPSDIEAALAAYENEMFPRSAVAAAEAVAIFDTCFGPNAPQGLLEMFAGAAR
jgi:hypothetical protein